MITKDAEESTVAALDNDQYGAVSKVLKIAGIGSALVPVMEGASYLDITTGGPFDVHLWYPEEPDDVWTITYHKRDSGNPVWNEAHMAADAPLSDVVTMVRDIITEFTE